MRFLSFCSILAILTVSLACTPADQEAPATGQAPCALTAADAEAIRAWEKAHETEVLAANWEAMSQYYAPDIIAMPPNQAEVSGREALVAWLETLPPITEYELTFDEVEGCGDLAYVRGRYSMAMHAADSTEVVRDTGRWLWILRRNPEGRWLLARDIFNSGEPVAIGE